jgi:hypothetical protein
MKPLILLLYDKPKLKFLKINLKMKNTYKFNIYPDSLALGDMWDYVVFIFLRMIM